MPQLSLCSVRVKGTQHLIKTAWFQQDPAPTLWRDEARICHVRCHLPGVGLVVLKRGTSVWLVGIYTSCICLQVSLLLCNYYCMGLHSIINVVTLCF